MTDIWPPEGAIAHLRAVSICRVTLDTGVDTFATGSEGRLEGFEPTAVLDPVLAELPDLVLLRRRYFDRCASIGRLSGNSNPSRCRAICACSARPASAASKLATRTR